MSRNENREFRDRLGGFEGLEIRTLMAADLGVAMLDMPPVPADQEALVRRELQDSSPSQDEVSDTDTDTTEFDSAASDFGSAAADSIREFFNNLGAEDLDFVAGMDLLGIKDLVDVAEGLGGFNPPEVPGNGGIDIPDFADPEGFGGSDTGSAPAAGEAGSLLRPSSSLADHAGGIASTDPGPKETTNIVRSVTRNEHTHPNGDRSWTDGSGSRVTETDGAGQSIHGMPVRSGTRTTTVKPNGTVITEFDVEFENGRRLTGTHVSSPDGREDADYHLSPEPPSESVDPDAEPTAVVLPHQLVPDFDPRSGLENPDLVNPGQLDDSGPKAERIDPGDSLVVNPAGAASQAREVSRELAEHWKAQLLERAGGLVNPPGEG